MVPERYGSYRVYEQLGKGGMATVHRAEQDTPRGVRQVALKRMVPTLDRRSVALFLDEARLLRYLQHPNIPETYDSGRVFGTYFIAMEYIPGRTLKDLITHCRTTVGPVPEPIVLNLAIAAVRRPRLRAQAVRRARPAARHHPSRCHARQPHPRPDRGPQAGRLRPREGQACDGAERRRRDQGQARLRGPGVHPGRARSPGRSVGGRHHHVRAAHRRPAAVRRARRHRHARPRARAADGVGRVEQLPAAGEQLVHDDADRPQIGPGDSSSPRVYSGAT